MRIKYFIIIITVIIAQFGYGQDLCELVSANDFDKVEKVVANKVKELRRNKHTFKNNNERMDSLEAWMQHQHCIKDAYWNKNDLYSQHPLHVTKQLAVLFIQGENTTEKCFVIQTYYHNYLRTKGVLYNKIVGRKDRRLLYQSMADCEGLITLFRTQDSNIQKNVLVEVGRKQENPLIPIYYDFDNLNLHLNASISDSTSKKFWVWDHTAGNDGPDSTRLDYYNNYDQELFLFNSEKTRPGLSVVTNKNIIIELSATIIFRLPDEGKESLMLLLNSLTTFNLLQDENIKTKLSEDLSYKNSDGGVEESIEIILAEEGDVYDRINYTVKTKLHTTKAKKNPTVH